jgi:hypothetical protein
MDEKALVSKNGWDEVGQEFTEYGSHETTDVEVILLFLIVLSF